MSKNDILIYKDNKSKGVLIKEVENEDIITLYNLFKKYNVKVAMKERDE